MKRTHDTLYLNEDNTNPKDSFKHVAKMIDPTFSGKLGDVGCATGAFPRYLRDLFSNATIHGIEYLDELLDKAKKDFPDITFKYGNVLDPDSVEEQYDIITMVGVLSIFNEYETVIKNVLSWLKPNGELIINGLITEYDYDVFVQYKKSSTYYDLDKLETGWNIISIESLNQVCCENHAVIEETCDFNISVEIPKREDDVIRSWTERDVNGVNQLYNALHLRQPRKTIKIRKNTQ